MLESVYPALASNLGMLHARGGAVPERTGNRHGGLAESPYNVYPTADGHIAIIGNHDRHFAALLQAMGREELAADARFSSLKARIANMDAVDELVGAWTAQHGKDALAARLRALRVPCAPVRNLAEVIDDPHLHARGSLERQSHPEFGEITVQRSPIRLEGAPRTEMQPSARLGADNATVYGDWLGLTPAELQALADDDSI